MNQILNLMKSNTGRFKSLLVPPSSKSSSNFSMKPFIRTPTIPIGVLVYVVNDEITKNGKMIKNIIFPKVLRLYNYLAINEQLPKSTRNSIADCTHYTLSSVDIIDIRISYKG